MKNLLIALLSIAVVVLAFLLHKSKCDSQNENFGFTSEYKEYLENLKMENVSFISPDTAKFMVAAYIDSLAKYRGHAVMDDIWKSKNIEKYVSFSISELDKLLLKIPDSLNRKDCKLKVYFGHYADTKEIKDYLGNNAGTANLGLYLNRNTVILQLSDKNGKNLKNAAMNVGSICPPKCSNPEDEYYPAN